ncbi:hypothetical protein ACH46N_25295 [Streptomyces pristinaespiralis]|uniref:DUF3558 domain-containing protein n=2 Tax=Streptomyces pristinaespiralis TaxID=38300 RepID=B5HDE1_STRE2|nr:hypothetical protein [Streptomyces pristinaespiralis]ALC22917.1 hypothetical protein SPRI_4611 [Streptomyces pristinaespiralis]EDY64852.1 conserved hypothetical protein [Streptomyces pristinaespiralis ATCC 25486]QMU14542.1 hypothetical protein H3L99_13805 [Streptomyces pristinaespiralis]
MHRHKNIAASALVSMLLMTALTSCSGGETRSVPKLPARVCWNAFDGEDVASLLPTGDRATVDTDPFVLAKPADSPTCSIYIDGNTKFQTYALYEDFERSIDWSSYEKAHPEPIDVGEKGIVWYDGAASYIICEASKTPSSPGKYIDLTISTSDLPDEEKLRRALPALMKQFVAFAQRELNCTGAPRP